jgi:hypothetical protein
VASLSDLTSLAAVKAWIGSVGTGMTSDAILSSLITSTSQQILTHLGRGSLLPVSYSEVRDGFWPRREIMLRRWPVIEIESISIDGVLIPPAPPLVAGATRQTGWTMEQVDPFPPGRQTTVYFRNLTRGHDPQGTFIQYTAGYQQTESWTVPASPFAITLSEPLGAWASDAGVVYSLSGLPLTPVAANPANGQYSVAGGVYTFSPEDVYSEAQISYGYVPSALAEACTSAVGDRYAYRQRIGINSKALAGQETTTFAANALSMHVKSAIDPFRSFFTPD